VINPSTFEVALIRRNEMVARSEIKRMERDVYSGESQPRFNNGVARLLGTILITLGSWLGGRSSSISDSVAPAAG
jgi:hypothetical protein